MITMTIMGNLSYNKNYHILAEEGKKNLYVKTNEDSFLNYKPMKTKQLQKCNQGEKFAPNLSSSLTIFFFSLQFLTFSVTTSTKSCAFFPFCWKNKQTVAISVKAMLFFGWLALASAHRAVSSSGSHPATWINQSGSKHNSVWAQKSVLQTCFQPERFQFTALQHRRKYTMPIWNSNIFGTKLFPMPLGLFLHSSSFSL